MGVGKMRHVAVAHFFFQEWVKKKRVIVNKVKGTRNPADILTKFMDTGEAVRNAVE